jgi:hypothetical protein
VESCIRKTLYEKSSENYLKAFHSVTVRRSNAGGGDIFCTCPDRSLGPPSLLYNGYRVSTGGKERPGRDAVPSLSSSAVVKKG